jgi:hypothetical protein
MNKQKLISALQSRIAKRRNDLKILWKKYQSLGDFTSFGYIYFIKERANALGYEQKVDKALLKMLQSPFDAGYAVGYQDACKAVKLTLEACECQN